MNGASTLEQDARPALALHGVGKRFGRLEVLRGISLEIGQGEIIALLGRSGCGKSTLLNILSGLLPADDGDLRLYGDGAAAFRQWNRIVYMFQEDRLLPWRSVWRNVAFALEAGALPRAERHARALAALRQVRLEEFADAWPHQLSGGMRSRVALARSLVAEPDILLMDEPFSKLDPQTRSQMHEELLRLQRLSGMTVVFVTHDVEEAVVLADRIAVLEPRPGRIRTLHPVDLPHPRTATDLAVSERIRRLRLEV